MKLNRLLGLALATSLTASATGCYGSFALTKKIYDFNGSIADKWLRQIVFWAFVIVPVYGVCTFVDAIVFNLIEFWTGDQVLTRVDHADGSQTELARLDENTVRIRRFVDGQVKDELELVKAGPDAAFARRPDGTWVSQVEMLSDGTLVTREDTTTRVLTGAKVSELALEVQSLGITEALGTVRTLPQSDTVLVSR